MGDFISEDDLRTFEGWLSKYQGYNPAALTPDELTMWRETFDELTRRLESTPRVGLMKLRAVAGEQKYAVAIQDDSHLWLTMWVRCSSPKGEIFIMYPRAGSDSGNPHASYHRDGNFHQKSHDRAILPQKRQPLNAAFRESEHLELYMGHGKTTGAVCDPKAFDGVVIVEPGILGPRNGSVGVDLVASGYEATWERDTAGRFYFGDVVQAFISVTWFREKFFRVVRAPRWRLPYKGHDRWLRARDVLHSHSTQDVCAACGTRAQMLRS